MPTPGVHAGTGGERKQRMSQADLLLKIARSSVLEHADIEFGSLSRQSLVQYSREERARDGSPRRFLVASLTKPIVAMAALKLAAEGEFSLSDRIRDFVPDYEKAAFRRITIRHLLTHTSGLRTRCPTTRNCEELTPDWDSSCMKLQSRRNLWSFHRAQPAAIPASDSSSSQRSSNP